LNGFPQSPLRPDRPRRGTPRSSWDGCTAMVAQPQGASASAKPAAAPMPPSCHSKPSRAGPRSAWSPRRAHSSGREREELPGGVRAACVELRLVALAKGAEHPSRRAEPLPGLEFGFRRALCFATCWRRVSLSRPASERSIAPSSSDYGFRRRRGRLSARPPASRRRALPDGAGPARC
jgi:hypothetical protein